VAVLHVHEGKSVLLCNWLCLRDFYVACRDARPPEAPPKELAGPRCRHCWKPVEAIDA